MMEPEELLKLMDKSDKNIQIFTDILQTYTGLPDFCISYFIKSNKYICLFDDGIIVPFIIKDGLEDYEYGDIGESIVQSYLDQTQEFGMGVK